MKKYPLLVFLLSLLYSALLQAAVWQATSSWDATTEKNYRAWVLAHWTSDFFTQPGPFQYLKMDCADAVYSMRLIYAYTAKLPFVMNDPTGGPKFISQEMGRWDSLPEDQRVRNFLQFALEISSTGSLMNDTYPVALNRESLGPGSIIQTDLKNHHSWTIQSFNNAGVPFLIFGSRPATTVLYTRFEYPSSGFVFPLGLASSTNAGFKNFKQPQDLAKPALQVPGSSDEQYRIPANRWSKEIQRKMALINEDLNTYAQRALLSACQSLKERRDIVLQGDQLNRSLGNQCMDATQYDDFSTPNRDQRFLDQAIALNEVYQQWNTDRRALDTETGKHLESVSLGEASGQDPDAFCIVEVKLDLTITLGQVMARLQRAGLSANPMDSIESRWGFSSQSSEKAKRCPQF